MSGFDQCLISLFILLLSFGGFVDIKASWIPRKRSRKGFDFQDSLLGNDSGKVVFCLSHFSFSNA